MGTKRVAKRPREPDSKGKKEGDIFEVSKIVDEIKIPHQYRVRWKGYGPSDDTWEDASTLNSARGAVRAYKAAKTKRSKR
jgi:hypothetical protein